MKHIILFFLWIYQMFISPLLHAATGTSSSCRYNPTCSEYAKQVISTYGVMKGTRLALQRLATCHPFAKVNQDKYNTTT